MEASHFSLAQAIRPNIYSLPVYVTSTSDANKPRCATLLDANENSIGSCLGVHVGKEYAASGQHDAVEDGALHEEAPTGPKSRPTQSALTNGSMHQLLADMIQNLNRYPSASQARLKSLIANVKGLPDANHVCIGVGAADLVDLLIRVTCTPSKDALLTAPPTFGLYKARAALNDIACIQCPLDVREWRFVLSEDKIFHLLDSHNNIKLVFLASPGNPTGDLIPLSTIERILSYPNFKGVVVVDEAYMDLVPSSETCSATSLIHRFPNLVVLNTFSKSAGLAGLRLGMLYAQPEMVQICDKVQMPYTISTPTSLLACAALSPECLAETERLAEGVRQNRDFLLKTLQSVVFRDLGVGKSLGGNQANFIMFPILDRNQDNSLQPDDIRSALVVKRLEEKHSIAIRFIGNMPGCTGCVRVTVPSDTEQDGFLGALKETLEATPCRSIQ